MGGGEDELLGEQVQAPSDQVEKKRKNYLALIHLACAWITYRQAGIIGEALRYGKVEYLPDAEMKVRYGWTMDSGMPAVYMHLSSQDLDPKLTRIYSGKPTERQRPEFSPSACTRSSESNAPGMRFCGRCGMPLDRAELVKSSVTGVQEGSSGTAI